MAHEIPDNKTDVVRIPFRMHPRVFAALGADLVTNDVVAVIELVKNSYDAFARNVWLRFWGHDSQGKYLEIEDDGRGMTKEIIENVWCLVATPYKELNSVVKSDAKERRVSGEKGLGRLSAARLGKRLNMLTQAPGDSCWDVRVNWEEISEKNDVSGSYAECARYNQESPFEKSGTRLRIHGLNRQWEDNDILDLQDNLARLISPFSNPDDLNIFLSAPDHVHQNIVKIESPDFLSKPKYKIQGSVDCTGNVRATYQFVSISEDITRKKELILEWKRIHGAIQDPVRFRYSPDTAHCGPFSFEMRAWDIASADTQEIAERFEFQKSRVRKAIRTHKGISVYRDDILVLPKSDNARDWLGLDIRRVSKTGTRLSTNQLVGYVSISAKNNPQIKDTSDRERLASCVEVAEFEEILKAIVALLENERDEDRIKPDREKPMDDLFGRLSTKDFQAEIMVLSEKGAGIREVVPLLQNFSSSLETTRKTIQERFVYYSRLATVGTIAHMLVHEIRNRTTAFGSFLDAVKAKFSPFNDKDIKEEFYYADKAVDALERLADTFAPLASRSFRRRKRRSILENQIKDCLMLHRGEIKAKAIRCQVPETETLVAVDPGELDAIILNLVTNAIYWMQEVPKENRELRFYFTPVLHQNRVRVHVDDTGPGIAEEDLEKIFWPGLTRKPGGIGMGLTVASELVAAYDGRMSTEYGGLENGASFAFDLPLWKQK